MSKKPSKDRMSLCTFAFADGRQCKLPRHVTEPDLCYFHARKLRAQLNAEEAGRQISAFLDTDILTACELNSAFAALFSATVRGIVKPKTASALTNLGQLMLKTHLHAKEEFLDAFEQSWGEITCEATSFAQPDSPPPDDDQDPDDSADPEERGDSADSEEQGDSSDPEELDDSSDSQVDDVPNDPAKPDSAPPSTTQSVPFTPDSSNANLPLPRIVFR